MSFLDAEAAIVTRLEAKLAAKLPDQFGTGKPGKVTTAPDVAQIEEQSQFTPAVVVVYNGFAPTQPGNPGPKVQELEQEWLVVITVRNRKTTVDGKGARAEASPIVDAVIQALLGFKVGPGWSALKVSETAPADFTDGFMYLPVTFTTKATYRGDPD